MAGSSAAGAAELMTMWSMAVPDWERRLMAGTSLVPANLPLNRSEADRALRVLTKLRLYDVPGTPTMGEAAGPWLFPIVEALFGSYDPETARRAIQEVFLLISKKNAKTTYGALIMLTAAIVNRRPAAEGTLIAPTKDIADRAYKAAKGAIRLDPVLDEVFHVQDNIKRITNRRDDATLEVKSSDTDVVTGIKSTYTMIDETHVFAARSRAADAFTEIRGALAARPDGFLFQITTQSKNPPSGVFKAELHNARDVRDGNLSLPILPVLYEFPQKVQADQEWKERRFWKLVNPNMGRGLDEEFIANGLMKAEREGAHALALFASQHLNIEIGIGQRTDRWPGADFWLKRSTVLTFDDLLRRCEAIVVGLDGGGLDDIYGACFLGREKETKRWLAVMRGWAHNSVFDRRKSISATLKDFEAAGELAVVGDELDDIKQIIEHIQIIKDAGLLAGVAADPAGLGEMVDALADIEITQENGLLKGAPQGYAMMNAIKTAERKLANGTLLHDGSALGTWAVSNLKIEPTATAIRATKQNAGDAKIDPAMALFDAVTVMSLNPEPVGAGISDFIAAPIIVRPASWTNKRSQASYRR